MSFLNIMHANLKETSVCSNCTRWKLQSAEYWGSSYEAVDAKGMENSE